MTEPNTGSKLNKRLTLTAMSLDQFQVKLPRRASQPRSARSECLREQLQKAVKRDPLAASTRNREAFGNGDERKTVIAPGGSQGID
jgi:hypothetical protein